VADKHTFVYVDDSGDDEIGASMSALLLPAEQWSTCLKYWTRLREQLDTEFGLPKYFEIHSNAFLSAHPLKDLQAAAARRIDILSSRIEAEPALDTIALARAQLELADVALDQALAAAFQSGRKLREISSAARMNAPDVNDRLQRGRSLAAFAKIECLAETPGGRRKRTKIYNQLLDQINAFPGAKVITVCADDGTKGAMSRVYAELLKVIEDLLFGEDRWGTVIVDGTPSARTQYYRDAHRGLDLTNRRILEDEVLRDSSESHFIQMADICAHSAFGVRQQKAHGERYLRLKDVIITADGNGVSASNPGFYGVPAG